MAEYNLQELVIGGFADFIPHGSTVDLVTTGPDAQPDDDPITNWTDWNLGCVTTVNFEKDEETDEVYCPSELGGYRKETKIRVVSDRILLTLQSHSEPVFRLLMGMDAELTGATGQVPFENTGDRQITGWLRLRGKGDDGTELILMKIEVKLRLQDYPGWSQATTYPIVSCEVLTNDLNDLIDTGILVTP